MRKKKRNLATHIIMTISILLICVGFVLALVRIEQYAKEECFRSIAQSTQQAVDMFTHTMEQNEEQLTLFANILEANSPNSDEILMSFMEHFCNTQSFTAVCVHRADLSSMYYGSHPHSVVHIDTDTLYREEVARLPYVSDVIKEGGMRSEQYIYQAVPILRDGEAIAILYGYISLDTLPRFLSSTAYGGEANYYITDGTTGDFLMNEVHRYGQNNKELPLGNLSDVPTQYREVKRGYTYETMRGDISTGRSGYFVFCSGQSGEWYYTYYMPLGINNWSMQMTIDEPTAFQVHDTVGRTILMLMIVVALLFVIIAATLFLENMRARRENARSLHRADYMNEVQAALISAHNNPDFVEQALKIIAGEVKAETALLLTFTDRVVTQAQYWPSKDKLQAMAMLGINIRDVFPVLFDALTSGKSICYDGTQEELELSDAAQEMFLTLDVRNIMLVPIQDTAGLLRGAIAVVNVPPNEMDASILECVASDFFMAIANLENHNIIKNMGAMDYLTGLKNRNSYEAELANYEVVEAETLWCVYIDVNGLHEVNNTQGHKAGDIMLCIVADTIKKIFGAKDSYRLGGDEFVCFLTDSEHRVLMQCKHRLLSELGRRGYSVSVGFEGTTKNENHIFDVERVVADAEAIMYRDKRAYYENNNIPVDRGHFPKADETPADMANAPTDDTPTDEGDDGHAE